MTHHREKGTGRTTTPPARRLLTGLILLFVVFLCGRMWAAPAENAGSPSRIQAPSAVPSDPVSIRSRDNDMALFLAGIDIPRESEFHALEETPAWKSYAVAAEASWARFSKNVAVRVRGWSKRQLRDISRANAAVFYPFGGPDILYPLLLFPEARTYLLIGLEPAGRPLDPRKVSEESLGPYFSMLEKPVSEILEISFFRVLDLSEDLAAKGLGGTLPILLATLARTGNTVEAIRPVEVSAGGEIAGLEAFPAEKKFNQGVEVSFRAEGGRAVKRLYYMTLDLENLNLARRVLARQFLERQAAGAVTFIKAASYLMHLRYFSTIRSIILGKSGVIVQEDSGIPFRFFDPNVWAIRLYGAYTEPIDMFKSHFQQDLKDAYASGARKLGFRFGYSPQPNLLVARRKS